MSYERDSDCRILLANGEGAKNIPDSRYLEEVELLFGFFVSVVL